MTATELFQIQLSDTTYQLQKCLEGLTEADADFRVAPTAMSFRDMVVHLCEVYEASMKMSAGEKHAWGTYEAPNSEWSAATAEMWRLRELATVALAKEDMLKMGSDFIVSHDTYHVGQLVLTRLAHDSTWDSYVIYRH